MMYILNSNGVLEKSATKNFMIAPEEIDYNDYTKQSFYIQFLTQAWQNTEILNFFSYGYMFTCHLGFLLYQFFMIWY